MDEKRAELEELNKEQLIDMLVEMRQQLDQLTQIVQKQATRIQTLEDQIAKNSGNSGKPPSSDGLGKRRQSLRVKGQRQPGGQKGHPGTTLVQVSEPDHTIVHKLVVCPECAADLETVAVQGVEKRQIFDVPPVQLEVTEHQTQHKMCPSCQSLVKASFPSDIRHPVQYGTRIQAQAVYLNNYQLLPIARIQEFFSDWYGVGPSQAFVIKATQSLHTQLAQPLARIRTHLKQAPVTHCDETGLRVEAQLNWLHVVATAEASLHGVHPRRGQKAMHDLGILPDLQGCAVHDGWASYFQFTNCTHALCNAHHLRELRFITEQYDQTWATDMAQLLLDAKHEITTYPPQQNSLPPDRLAHYTQRYTTILAQGLAANPPPPQPPTQKRGRPKQSPPKNLLDRLQKYQTETLAFLSDFRVPFDNNLAERAVRMMKLKQKISGTFRTRLGADVFCDIRSYIDTARKQGQPVLQVLHDALLGQPFCLSD
jgi:transposase